MRVAARDKSTLVQSESCIAVKGGVCGGAQWVEGGVGVEWPRPCKRSLAQKWSCRRTVTEKRACVRAAAAPASICCTANASQGRCQLTPRATLGWPDFLQGAKTIQNRPVLKNKGPLDDGSRASRAAHTHALAAQSRARCSVDRVRAAPVRCCSVRRSRVQAGAHALQGRGSPLARLERRRSALRA